MSLVVHTCCNVLSCLAVPNLQYLYPNHTPLSQYLQACIIYLNKASSARIDNREMDGNNIRYRNTTIIKRALSHLHKWAIDCFGQICHNPAGKILTKLREYILKG